MEKTKKEPKTKKQRNKARNRETTTTTTNNEGKTRERKNNRTKKRSGKASNINARTVITRNKERSAESESKKPRENQGQWRTYAACQFTPAFFLKDTINPPCPPPSEAPYGHYCSGHKVGFSCVSLVACIARIDAPLPPSSMTHPTTAIPTTRGLQMADGGLSRILFP